MAKGRQSNQAVKLMIIRDYLYSHTNKDHWVTSKDIISHLASKGIVADRKTIFSDMNRLEDDYGIALDRGKKGYKLSNPQFEPQELRLMIDSVQSAKFISEKEAYTLSNKIKGLADIYTKATLDRKSYVNERIHSMESSIINRTDLIHSAISQNRKISFKYFHYNAATNRGKNYSKQGKKYTVSPFALYWNNGNYYLYAYLTEFNEFRFFRIDRMEATEIEANEREGNSLFSASVLNKSRKAKVFEMFSGEEVNVSIRFQNWVADRVIDTFGSKITLAPVNKDHFMITALVQVSPPFYNWVTSFGAAAKIIAPQSVVEGMKDYINKICNVYEEE